MVILQKINRKLCQVKWKLRTEQSQDQENSKDWKSRLNYSLWSELENMASRIPHRNLESLIKSFIRAALSIPIETARSTLIYDRIVWRLVWKQKATSSNKSLYIAHFVYALLNKIKIIIFIMVWTCNTTYGWANQIRKISQIND